MSKESIIIRTTSNTVRQRETNAAGTIRHLIKKRTWFFCSAFFSALSRNPLKGIVRVVVTAVFVFLVNKEIGRRELHLLSEAVRAIPVVVGFSIGTISIVIQIVRWRMILRLYGMPSDGVVAAKTMFNGFLLAFLTPGRVGEFFRATELDKSRKKLTVLAVVTERFFAVVITLCIGLLCCILHAVCCDVMPFVPLVVASTLLCGAAAGLILLVKNGSRWLQTIPFLGNMSEGIAILRCAGRTTVVTIGFFSTIIHLLLLLQTAVFFTMFGSVGFLRGILVAGEAYVFMLLFPVLIANIGLREYAFGFFLTKNMTLGQTAGMVDAISLGTSLVILLFNIIIPAAVGLLVMYSQKSAKVMQDGSRKPEKHTGDEKQR